MGDVLLRITAFGIPDVGLDQVSSWVTIVLMLI